MSECLNSPCNESLIRVSTGSMAEKGGQVHSVSGCRYHRLVISSMEQQALMSKGRVIYGYIKSGAVRLQIPELGMRAASAGHWFVLSAVDHAIQLYAMEPTVICMVESDQVLLNRLAGSVGHNSTSIACLLCSHRSVSAFYSTVALGEERVIWNRLANFAPARATDYLYQQAYMYEVIARVMENPSLNQGSEIPCDAVVGTNRDEDSLCKVAAWLEANLGENHSLSALARRFGLNECKLKRGFKGVFGITVFGYLRRRRMEYAAGRLNQSNSTILEIADEVGYSNPSHFSRAFEAEFGCLPKDYRRREQERAIKLQQV